MQNYMFYRVLLVSVLAVLMGCGPEESLDGGINNSGNVLHGLTVTTATGDSVVLQGVFKTPCVVMDLDNDGVDDSMDFTFEVTGLSARSYHSEYYSDVSCFSANETIIWSHNLDITVGSDALVSLWTDDDANTTNDLPPASVGDSAVLLPQASNFTILNAVVTQSTSPSALGASEDIGFVVDDSGAAGLKMYSAFFNGTAGVVFVGLVYTNY
ncbi:MAG: hypothetical protein OEY36_00530 [Gammaproteobacteria bacterium]|nr:hypothetical protein [Gammaproteobacteria bacterium]